MERSLKNLVVVLFLIMLASLGYYTAKYTYRIKREAWTYHSDDEISCFSITSMGGLMGIGGKEGSLILLSRGSSVPRWRYYGNSSIKSLIMASEGNFLVAQDSSDMIHLFSQTPHIRDGVIYPLWTNHLPASELRDIYSSSGILPSVYVTATRGGSIHLFSKKGEELWEYETGAEGAVTTFSRDGTLMASGDHNGGINLFRVESPSPLWSISTGSRIVSISISFDKRYIVAGGETEDKKGQIYLFSVDDAEIIYNRQVESSIRDVHVSHDGRNVVAGMEDGAVITISNNGNTVNEDSIHIRDGIQSIMLSPFGSYLVASNTEGEIYLRYLPRPAPLWRFDVQDSKPLVEITNHGESVFVSDSHHVFFLSNSKLSEMIPGSRFYWAIFFFFGVGSLFSPIVLKRENSILTQLESGDWLSIVLGFLVGMTIGLLITKDIGKAVLICGIGSLIGSSFSWRNRSIISFLSGCYLGFFGSGIAGFLLGLIIWFGGDERHLLQLIMENAFYGLKIGATFGPLGATVGAIIVGLFLPWITRAGRLNN